eukprot:gene7727-10501_t
MEKSLTNHEVNFQKLERSLSNIQHKVIIAIKQRNLNYIERKLIEISNPSHLNYGRYWTREEIAHLTINSESLQYVQDFLIEFGNSKNYSFSINVSQYKEYLSIVAPISIWEELFNTTFYEYKYLDQFNSMNNDINDITRKQTFHRAHVYSLPKHISNHIITVLNTVQFPHTSSGIGPKQNHVLKSHNIQLNGKCSLDSVSLLSGYVTPALINNVYAIYNNTGNQLTSQCVFATSDQTFSPSDLEIFQSYFGLPIEAVSSVIGTESNDSACAYKSGTNCLEANLDVQYLMAISQGVPTVFYYSDNYWTDFLVEVANMTDPPKVISISYGSVETHVSNSEKYLFSIEAQKLSLQGVTILASSGDQGVLGNGIQSSSACSYLTLFPASSPYVTAIGATSGPESSSTEVACEGSSNSITTGGGFSSYYATPSWQSDAVDGYFSSISIDGISVTSGYDTNGRGYPDISLVGTKYLIKAGGSSGSYKTVHGTSASCPVFAGMISLVNAARKAVGKSTVGWINPTLYKYHSNFTNDVTSGENKCTTSGTICCSQGFTCTTGWDPVTGFGSVNFTRMKDLFLSLGNDLNIPTVSPTSSPLLIPFPTANPTTSFPTTAMPTISTSGWFYEQLYSGSSCSGDILRVIYYPTNQCVPFYKDSSIIKYSKYACSEAGASVKYYSSSSCSDSSQIEELLYSFDCEVQDVTFYYSDGNELSNFYGCTNVSSPSLPQNAYSYIKNVSYAESNRCSTVIRITYSMISYCFNLLDSIGNSYKSYQYTSTHLQFFQETGCTSIEYTTYIHYTISLGACTLYNKYPLAILTKLVNPTNQPTHKPSVCPSYKPTRIPTISMLPSADPSFTPTAYPSINPTESPSIIPSPFPSLTTEQSIHTIIKINLVNVTSFPIQTNTQQALINTTASVMTLNYSSFSYNRSDLLSFINNNERKLSSTNISIITNNSLVTISSFINYDSNPSKYILHLFHNGITALNSSIQDGSFGIILKEQALLFGSNQLKNVTVDSFDFNIISYSSFQSQKDSPSASPNSNRNNQLLSNTIIYSIAGSGFILLILSFSLVYYYIRTKKSCRIQNEN